MNSQAMQSLFRYQEVNEILLQYERSKILEVYFSRLDGRKKCKDEERELYELSLEDLKLFLAGKFKEDPIMQQLSNLHSQVLENKRKSS